MDRMGQLITVGITGQGGFMGTHLYNFLGTKPKKINRINFQDNYFENEVDLQNFVKSCDVIVHLAAMNRHEDEQVIYNTNIDLVKKLINACEATNSSPKIIFSSSTQEEKDNLYGKSKLDGRKYFEAWAIKNSCRVLSLIIPNVFGPFGKPFYNSFIATFSHQVIQGKKPKIINDSKVNLIYINELSDAFYNEIIKKDSNNIQSYVISHTSSRKVSEILGLLKHFKTQYIENGQVPKLDLNTFELDLFNTFTSFIPKEYFPRKHTQHT
jgi:UDP-2-acetamido-2,6-beta-L-arabino-hexul-4-ose reductase